ncbi:alpha/beta hydrolase [Marmoricola endophyticus]|uniref:Alpha/beta hydrolase n=1 Tax=Marmoricola endophyticus TaxID=2040280 RepID=A0A917BM73_9ACTN|nr:alpha/beta hydrolase [Marmoricola endophyticus]GGF51281.1 alpha/beta hydrolase [Marmoricola endophyticus]
MHSADGTRIGFLEQGTGPGVVLVQGAMADVSAYRRLAEALEGSHTVFRVERRGRGLSPRPYDHGHDVARDVEDVDAVLEATGASTVFGLSSGAIITLEAALTLTRAHQVAVYEPPFYPHGVDEHGVRRIDEEIERGDLGAALLDALLVAGTAPRLLERVPRPIAHRLAGIVVRADHLLRHGSTSFAHLLPGVRYDFHDVAQLGANLDRYSTLRKPVLLISGTTSPPFLREAATRLTELLPDVRHVELVGLGHDGPWNGGGPRRVAALLEAWARPPTLGRGRSRRAV